MEAHVEGHHSRHCSNISPGGAMLQHVFEGRHLALSELGAK